MRLLLLLLFVLAACTPLYELDVPEQEIISGKPSLQVFTSESEAVIIAEVFVQDSSLVSSETPLRLVGVFPLQCAGCFQVEYSYSSPVVVDDLVGLSSFEEQRLTVLVIDGKASKKE